MACPACGGQIHPIAGRCKHCKADLARLRAAAPPGRGAPPAQRPNLVALGAAAAPALPSAGLPPLRGGNGHAAPVVMPPFPSHAPDDAPRASWSSRWPLVVALIAVVAIVASIALLVFGGGTKKKHDGARRNDGPAPEMMPTDPQAPQIMPQAPGGGTAPHAQGITPDPSTPTPIIPSIPPPSPPSSGGAGPTSAPADVRSFATQAIDVTCRRLSSCGGSDPMIATYCTMARDMVPQMDDLEQMCGDYDRAAAAQCLDAVSRFPCPGGNADYAAMAQTLMGLSGCQQVCPNAAGMMGSLDYAP